MKSTPFKYMYLDHDILSLSLTPSFRKINPSIKSQLVSREIGRGRLPHYVSIYYPFIPLRSQQHILFPLQLNHQCLLLGIVLPIRKTNRRWHLMLENTNHSKRPSFCWNPPNAAKSKLKMMEWLQRGGWAVHGGEGLKCTDWLRESLFISPNELSQN